MMIRFGEREAIMVSVLETDLPGFEFGPARVKEV